MTITCEKLIRKFSTHGPLLTKLIQQLAAVPPIKPLKGRGSSQCFWKVKLHASKKLHDQNSARQAIFLDQLLRIAPSHIDIYMCYTGRSGGKAFFSPCIIVSPEAEALFKTRVEVTSPKLVNAENEWLRVDLDLKPIPVMQAA